MRGPGAAGTGSPIGATAGRGSYNVRTIAASTAREIERLRAQVELFWPSESHAYRALGLADGLSVVELGCGPGFLLEKLRTEFRGLDITGLEIDEFLASRARSHLDDLGFTDVRLVVDSIDDSGLEDSSFDFAIARLVLEHLPAPLRAVREVRRILKPGGTAIFVDNDFDLHLITYPHIEELQDLYGAYCRLRFAEGGNPKIGRELPRLLRDAGFADLRFSAISAHSTISGDDAFLRSEGIGIPARLVRRGYLSSGALGRIMGRWQEMLRRDDHVIVRQLYMASGRNIED